ncbi:transcription termination/antitermination protein NusG [Rhizobium lentis]|uniref:transcription termination/antitermination protein NusG n=1 Tax=Rhizobium lentis TaxID=1138194 RepID=UPI002180CE6F|nr:transcription termination/antitermination NusG family protein [Rhizobium lentis]
MVHDGKEIDVSRALPAMDKTMNRSRITEANLLAASSERFAKKPKNAKWYCLHVMTGRESSVEKTLEAAKIELVSPREKVVLVKKGKKIETSRLFFPGYILVHCQPSAEAFHGLRSMKNVLDIVGNGGKYHVIADEQVSVFKGMTDLPAPRVTTDKSFCEGDRAMITFGPFKDFDCVVLAVKWSREARARVQLAVFGKNFEIESMPLAFLEKL